MNIDKKTLDKILRLNDEQLKLVIYKLADGTGVDLSGVDISPTALSSIRAALSSATDSDLDSLKSLLDNYKKK